MADETGPQVPVEPPNNYETRQGFCRVLSVVMLAATTSWFAGQSPAKAQEGDLFPIPIALQQGELASLYPSVDIPLEIIAMFENGQFGYVVAKGKLDEFIQLLQSCSNFGFGNPTTSLSYTGFPLYDLNGNPSPILVTAVYCSAETGSTPPTLAAAGSPLLIQLAMVKAGNIAPLFTFDPSRVNSLDSSGSIFGQSQRMVANDTSPLYILSDEEILDLTQHFIRNEGLFAWRPDGENPISNNKTYEFQFNDKIYIVSVYNQQAPGDNYSTIEGVLAGYQAGEKIIEGSLEEFILELVKSTDQTGSQDGIQITLPLMTTGDSEIVTIVGDNTYSIWIEMPKDNSRDNSFSLIIIIAIAPLAIVVVGAGVYKGINFISKAREKRKIDLPEEATAICSDIIETIFNYRKAKDLSEIMAFRDQLEEMQQVLNTPKKSTYLTEFVHGNFRNSTQFKELDQEEQQEALIEIDRIIIQITNFESPGNTNNHLVQRDGIFRVFVEDYFEQLRNEIKNMPTDDLIAKERKQALITRYRVEREQMIKLQNSFRDIIDITSGLYSTTYKANVNRSSIAQGRNDKVASLEKKVANIVNSAVLDKDSKAHLSKLASEYVLSLLQGTTSPTEFRNWLATLNEKLDINTYAEIKAKIVGTIGQTISADPDLVNTSVQQFTFTQNITSISEAIYNYLFTNNRTPDDSEAFTSSAQRSIRKALFKMNSDGNRPPNVKYVPQYGGAYKAHAGKSRVHAVPIQRITIDPNTGERSVEIVSIHFAISDSDHN